MMGARNPFIRNRLARKNGALFTSSAASRRHTVNSHDALRERQKYFPPVRRAMVAAGNRQNKQM
jgi:hypothetical protein